MIRGQALAKTDCRGLSSAILALLSVPSTQHRSIDPPGPVKTRLGPKGESHTHTHTNLQTLTNKHVDFW